MGPGHLGPRQLGPGQLGPRQLGPGAQLSTFWGWTLGRWDSTVLGPICQESFWNSFKQPLVPLSVGKYYKFLVDLSAYACTMSEVEAGLKSKQRLVLDHIKPWNECSLTSAPPQHYTWEPFWPRLARNSTLTKGLSETFWAWIFNQHSHCEAKEWNKEAARKDLRMELEAENENRPLWQEKHPPEIEKHPSDNPFCCWSNGVWANRCGMPLGSSRGIFEENM